MSESQHWERLEHLYLRAPTNAYYRPVIRIGDAFARSRSPPAPTSFTLLTPFTVRSLALHEKAFCNDVTAETRSPCEDELMPRRLILPILLLLVTGSATGTTLPEPGDEPAPSDERTGAPIDLFWVRSMALVENRDRPIQSTETIREALTRWLPDDMQRSTVGADLLIDYSSSLSAKDDAQRAAHRVSWIAHLYRLDCQSPRFGERPTRAVRGHCENRVYVRVKLGTMRGAADDEASALEAFAAQLREALFTAVPAAEGD